MAKPKPKPKPKVVPHKPVIGGLPRDYIRGPKTSNNKYTAWKTRNGLAPDFGKGKNGPGTPYREISKTMPVRNQDPPIFHSGVIEPKPTDSGGTGRPGAIGRRMTPFGSKPKPITAKMDAKSRAIARRLGR